jgi:hypothetical protein
LDSRRGSEIFVETFFMVPATSARSGPHRINQPVLKLQPAVASAGHSANWKKIFNLANRDDSDRPLKTCFARNENFADSGFHVAILTANMRQAILALVLFASLVTVPAQAQHWSFGAGVGPFVFGDFARETLTPIGGSTGEPTTVKLTAKARPGFTADLERDLNDRFAIRLQGSFTDSKLQVKSSSAGGVSLDAGTLDVTTATLPIVIRFNPRGSFRFHIMGGPAYAMYRIKQNVTPAGTPDTFSGTRSEWGGAIGGGVAWWVGNRFAITGEIADIVTASPFDADEFQGSKVEVPKPQNIHTTVGIRVRF